MNRVYIYIYIYLWIVFLSSLLTPSGFCKDMLRGLLKQQILSVNLARGEPAGLGHDELYIPVEITVVLKLGLRHKSLGIRM